MLTIANASVRLNRTLQEAEEAVDHALERQAALLHSATLALRSGIKVDPARSQTTLLRMQKALSDLTSVRSSTLKVHGELLKFAVETGAFEEEKCPDLKTAELQKTVAA